MQPVQAPWPAAATGALPGWNPSPPPRKKGRGCGCVALLGLLVVVLLVGLAAIGGAFDDLIGTPGGGDGDLPAATKPLAGTIALGEERAIGSETSDPASNITLTAPPDGPVPGLKLRIPGEAYAAPVEFAVSARPVTVTGYDGMVTALSDLITVDNGGAYAASPMTVTIPVTIPAGMFAMGFFRHEDGSLEAMPLVDETSSSVTVATRHFSSFLVLAIAEAALPESIGTGFRAREDDFQSPNYGSYAAPYGACAGQSLSAMWYFLERRATGAPALWGLTDNLGRGGTLPFWQDDAGEYRLTGSVQRDTDWDALSVRLQIFVRKSNLDRLQWSAFRYAMLVTGQPQYVGLSQSGTEGGHAIVGYAATATGLWVADPNYPGKLRVIAWDAKALEFHPYDSGPTAADSDHHYDLIGLLGKTALIDWGAIGARWAQLEAGTIGADRYPAVTVEVEVTAADGTKSYEPLKPGPIATIKPLLGFSSVPGVTLRATFYRGTEYIRKVGDGNVAPVQLAYGINDLGVYLEALVDTKWRFVDFQRFELVAPAPSGMPTEAPPMPTPEPEPTYDCSVKPPGGIGAIDWSLHCESIRP
ncbi:MAG: hypothetical protein ACYC65_10785 [Candidatus Limnocylindrales bacterium]